MSAVELLTGGEATMPRGFIREQIFSIMIDRERWLVLETRGHHDWNLRVVGPEPLDVDLVELTTPQAKRRAVVLAKEHFRNANPRVIVARLQQWREALFVEHAYSMLAVRIRTNRESNAIERGSHGTYQRSRADYRKGRR